MLINRGGGRGLRHLHVNAMFWVNSVGKLLKFPNSTASARWRHAASSLIIAPWLQHNFENLNNMHFGRYEPRSSQNRLDKMYEKQCHTPKLKRQQLKTNLTNFVSTPYPNFCRSTKRQLLERYLSSYVGRTGGRKCFWSQQNNSKTVQDRPCVSMGS